MKVPDWDGLSLDGGITQRAKREMDDALRVLEQSGVLDEVAKLQQQFVRDDIFGVLDSQMTPEHHLELLNLPMSSPPATVDDIDGLRDEIRALQDSELRRRIAETHLRTEQMHRHFVPDEPQAEVPSPNGRGFTLGYWASVAQAADAQYA